MEEKKIDIEAPKGTHLEQIFKVDNLDEEKAVNQKDEFFQVAGFLIAKDSDKKIPIKMRMSITQGFLNYPGYEKDMERLMKVFTEMVEKSFTHYDTKS